MLHECGIEGSAALTSNVNCAFLRTSLKRYYDGVNVSRSAQQMVSFTAFMTFTEHVALFVNHKANSNEYIKSIS